MLVIDFLIERKVSQKMTTKIKNSVATLKRSHMCMLGESALLVDSLVQAYTGEWFTNPQARIGGPG